MISVGGDIYKGFYFGNNRVYLCKWTTSYSTVLQMRCYWCTVHLLKNFIFSTRTTGSYIYFSKSPDFAVAIAIVIAIAWVIVVSWQRMTHRWYMAHCCYIGNSWGYRRWGPFIMGRRWWCSGEKFSFRHWCSLVAFWRLSIGQEDLEW